MSSLGAFIETVRVYQELDVVGAIWAAGKKLMDGMNSIARELGIEKNFSVVGPACSPNYITLDKAGASSMEFRTIFHQELIHHSVLMPCMALAYAHGAEEIDMTLQATRSALDVYRRALNDGVDRHLEGRAIKPVFRKKN